MKGMTRGISSVLLAASVVIGVGQPSFGAGPSMAEASQRTLMPGARAVALDDVPSDGADPAGDGSSPAAPSPSDGLVRLSLVPGDNEARLIMRIRTLGQPEKEAPCATRSVTGDIVMTPDGAIVSELSQIVIDMQSLKCTPPLRDANAQALLETQTYPTAVFTFEQAPGLTVPLPDGESPLQFIGQQTVRGVTQPAQYDTTSTFGPSGVSGRAQSEQRMTSYGIKPPSIGPLLRVQDQMRVEVDFNFQMVEATTGMVPEGAAGQ